jgi:hypothetical protein
MTIGFNAMTWLIFGVLLLLLETMAAGFYMLFLGAAALCVTILLFIMPAGYLASEVQLFSFAAFSLASVFLAYKFKFYEAKSSHETLNEPQAALVGQSFTLDSAIENGRGTLKIGDSLWQISGENAVKGANVKIIGYEKEVLLVEVLL